MEYRMSLKFKYILFIGLLHAILVGLVYYLLKDKIWYFIASEFFVILSLYLSYMMYNSFIKPINLMQSGTDAIRDGDFSIKYNPSGTKEIDNLIEVYNSMIDQLRSERISKSEQSFFIQDLIEVTPLGIIIMDYDGNISQTNPAAQQMLNINDTGAHKNLTHFPSTLVSEILRMEIGETRILTPNGIDKYKCQVNQVVQQGFRRKFILIDDLSNEILKSEKDAYGRIIRMMAHEVNNSMGAINSILDSVVEFGFTNQGDPELKESLLIARDRNDGLKNFMHNYASVLRLPHPQMRKMDIAQLLNKSAKLFTPIATKQNITFDLNIPTHNLTVSADPILLEQAISNIIKNAIEAIGENGTIKISCSESPVSFTISDNGTGISKESESQLFTPFFSTKPAGQGVGLMLIRDILQSHNCAFSLSKNQDTRWTNFKVEF